MSLKAVSIFAVCLLLITSLFAGGAVEAQYDTSTSTGGGSGDGTGNSAAACLDIDLESATLVTLAVDSPIFWEPDPASAILGLEVFAGQTFFSLGASADGEFIEIAIACTTVWIPVANVVAPAVAE
jgi:hypothetical protein